jgi:SAM-dependent methyltransferase
MHLENWFRDILVDPLGKEPLSEADGYLCTAYGRRYPIVNGIFDLRVLNNETTADQKTWREGQFEYTKMHVAEIDRDQQIDYAAEIASVKGVYEAISLEGRVLDVGGHQGRLRSFIGAGLRYAGCDPFLEVFRGIDKQPKLLQAFPFLEQPLNFVCCDAELLPFRSQSFDTVHMRSVIDHFLSPELALHEAYRVLVPNGKLIIGLYVEGGKLGKEGALTGAKEAVKRLISAVGIEGYKDHHIWHPTAQELVNLAADCAFTVEKTHWQEGTDEKVFYASFRKQATHSRKSLT